MECICYMFIFLYLIGYCLSDHMKTIIRYLRQEIKLSQQDLAVLAYKITRILNEATYGEDKDSYLSIEDIFKFSDGDFKN